MKNHCLDCGKEIYYPNKRCWKCYCQWVRIPENNGNYKDGRTKLIKRKYGTMKDRSKSKKYRRDLSKAIFNYFKTHYAWNKGRHNPINKDIKKYRHKYYYKNREKLIKYSILYRLKNKTTIHKKLMLKLKKDILFKIRLYLSNRLRAVLKRNSKLESTIKLIGCSVKQLKIHLESQFKPGMSWSNYGSGWNGRGMKEWHIDHIRPCASFDLRKLSEQRKCFHYTNLQPLWAEENLSKGKKFLKGEK